MLGSDVGIWFFDFQVSLLSTTRSSLFISKPPSELNAFIFLRSLYGQTFKVCFNSYAVCG